MPKELINFRISSELLAELKSHAGKENKTVSAWITEAIVSKLNPSDNSPSVLQNFEERITEWEKRLTEVEKRLAITSVHPSSVNTNVIQEASKPLQVRSTPVRQISGSWLTTGEAYDEAQRRGYAKSSTTFRRSLRGGTIPPELAQIRLIADFEARNRNPKDNSNKWLRFE